MSPHALHSVRGPIGPFRHSGVSVVMQLWQYRLEDELDALAFLFLLGSDLACLASNDCATVDA